MRSLRKVWAWLWPARATFIELEHLQARLVRSLLTLVAVIAVILLLRNELSPAFPRRPIFVFGALVGACLLALAWRPALSPWVLRILLVGSVAALTWAAVNWGSAVAPSLYYLLIFGLIGTLLDAPVSGNAVTLAALGLLLALRQKFGLPDFVAQALWANLCIGLLLTQALSLAFYHVFVGVQAQLSEQAQRLAQADGERRRLAGALFEGLQMPVQGLAQAAQRPLAEGGAHLKDQVRAVADQLQGAASLRQEPGPFDSGLQNDAGLDWLRQSFKVPAGALFLLYLGVLGAVAWGSGPRAAMAALPYLPALLLAGALLFGSRAAWGLAGVSAALLFWIGSTTGRSLADLAALGNLLLSLGMLAFLCRQAWNLHALLLKQLQNRANALGDVLSQRRRLLGALFHDINNPLAAIQAILQLPQVGVPLEPQDQQRVQKMAARIHQLVGAAATFYLVDTDVPASSLGPVDVPRLFADTHELFEARLRAKQQQLSLSAPPNLAVLSLPEVLRDSVLSNLVSNAIKFSPSGAHLFLEARLRNGDVGLVVRDTGVGLPMDVLENLARGLPVSSRPGSGGERGQGLGLGLVQEHLRRLGGRLELERLAGGGTEARVWLKRA